MKTRTIVTLVIVAAIVLTSFAFLLLKASKVSGERKESLTASLKNTITGTTNTAPAPGGTAPVIDKTKVLALLTSQNSTQDNLKAIETFKHVMRDTPPYVIVGTKGLPAALKGDYEKAIQICNTEINENPGAIEPRYTLAWIYAKTGQYQTANFLCDDILEHGSSFNKMRYIKAWVCAKQGRFDVALQTCNEALRDEPASAMLYYAKGRIMDISGDCNNAITAYKRAVELKMDYAEAYGFLGLLYTQLGRYDEAVNAFKQDIILARYVPGGYLGLGLVYEITGNDSAAIGQYNNAVTVGSFGSGTDAPKTLAAQQGIDNAVIFCRIGILNARLGNYNDAVKAFNKSLTSRPAYADAYRNLALTYLLLDDRASALQNYEQLKKFSPSSAAAINDLLEPASSNSLAAQGR